MNTSSILRITCFTMFFASVLQLYGQKYERYKVLKDTSLYSPSLKFERDIKVSVPIEWQSNSNQKYPLIIVFDSQNERSHGYILRTIDYLTSTEQMPSCIVVSVASTQQFRYAETLPVATNSKGLARANEHFLFQELIPLAENEWKASDFRLFIGHSRYGYFTTSLFQQYPDDLNAVISLSPFFREKNVNLIDSMSSLSHREFSSNKYYRFGIGDDYPEDFRAMEEKLNTVQNPTLNLIGWHFPHADHNATPGLIIGRALYEIFAHWSAQQAIYLDESQQNFDTIRGLEKEVRVHYGSDLRFSLGVLNGKGWQFYGNSDYEQAIQAWKILIKNYPSFSEAWLYIAETETKLGRDHSKSLQAFRQSIQNSEFYSDEEKKELFVELEQLNR
ncbi:MAG: hypothetical protein EP338_13840 [Bacteroidetes bacterium]|nr:MAG: hypothetical protein EP338_13840 [Bacteroidota bacterium]